MTDSPDWTVEHAWRGRIQTKAKPMIGEDGNPHGTLREFTGLVHVYCNCGFASGWVPAPPAEPGYHDLKALLPDECREAAERQEREILDAWAQEREPLC
ncbi:hypothetical protein [Streptomyces sp. NPDC008240]|uniref:hypothetical protein n=1 Tax=Streptomyces sp. NPDC008240 TaxID=3364822 RepID=UPI0036E46937